MMRKSFAVWTFFLLFCAVPTFLFAQEDLKKDPACKYCKMDRGKFAHSRILIEYDDETSVGTCSTRCAAVDLLQLDKTPKNVWVGDYITRQLIDAEKSFWVVGGNKPGVMTKRAKWAFEKKEDAQQFMKEFGGTPATYDEAMKATYEDIYADSKMIRERRKMRATQNK